MMPADLTELLRAFNAHGVKFLVVGGYALDVTGSSAEEHTLTPGVWWG
jgi:hypothetical protein